MKVVVYPADMGRCGHRLIWPAQALIDQGADVNLVLPTDPQERQLQADWRRYTDGRRELMSIDPPDADVVVFQRPLQRTLVESIPMLQAAGRRVVVEVDDDFSTISPRNVSWRGCHPAYSPDRNWNHLARACRIADLVTVTTPALARRYGGHGRVVVVPNHIPAAYLDITPEPHDGVIVGWSGSVDTHPDDLQVTRGGVARAVEATGARFAVVGTGVGVAERLGLAEVPPASGWVTLDEYPHYMAQLDVGIVPLELTSFNEAKSYLKGLEFAALGVPFVASPTGPYRGVPLARLASKGRDWEREVRALVEHPGARLGAASTLRHWAATQTVEANCGRWWEAWASVIDALKVLA